MTITIGTYPKANKPKHRISKLIIHPDYRQVTGDSVVGPSDVALVKTKDAIFGKDAPVPAPNFNKSVGTIEVQPICLPPPILNDEDDERYEHFEDMDCYLSDFTDKGAIFPQTSVDVVKGWLNCNPGGKAHAFDHHIIGRTSFITAYGSTARQDITSHPVRYQCLTNSYGPVESIYEHCSGKCHKEVKSNIKVKIGNNRFEVRIFFFLTFRSWNFLSADPSHHSLHLHSHNSIVGNRVIYILVIKQNSPF